MKQESRQKKLRNIAIIIVAAVILIDQIVKIIVKTHMQIGEEINVIGTWFRLHFTENEGFAFGVSFGGAVGKVALTLFRLVAVSFIAYLIARMIKRGSRPSLVICSSLILAGALGNLIDSCFYGLIFNESYYQLATLFPPEGGYGKFLQGRVVDMFYFPLFQFNWPKWLPLLGGKHFEFFNAIFNVADSAITIGVIWLIIDQFFISPKYSKSE